MNNLYEQKQRIWGGFNVTQFQTTASTTGSYSTPALKTTSHKIFVQRLKIVVLTGSAGKTLALADATTGVVLTPALDMSTGGTTYTFDFGPTGKVFTVNELLKATISAAGAAASVNIEGYTRT